MKATPKLANDLKGMDGYEKDRKKTKDIQGFKGRGIVEGHNCQRSDWTQHIEEKAK